MNDFRVRLHPAQRLAVDTIAGRLGAPPDEVLAKLVGLGTFVVGLDHGGEDVLDELLKAITLGDDEQGDRLRDAIAEAADSARDLALVRERKERTAG